jgi:hypothetical protein
MQSLSGHQIFPAKVCLVRVQVQIEPVFSLWAQMRGRSALEEGGLEQLQVNAKSMLGGQRCKLWGQGKRSSMLKNWLRKLEKLG